MQVATLTDRFTGDTYLMVYGSEGEVLAALEVPKSVDAVRGNATALNAARVVAQKFSVEIDRLNQQLGTLSTLLSSSDPSAHTGIHHASAALEGKRANIRKVLLEYLRRYGLEAEYAKFAREG